MVDYPDSSQLNSWLYRDDEDDELSSCRKRANDVARRFLFEREKQQREEEANKMVDGGGGGSTLPSSSSSSSRPPVENFACGYSKRRREEDGGGETADQSSQPPPPSENSKGHPYLDPDEESLLVSFYASKLPSLIGPTAQIPRLRRESKVAATSALLLRRFFLSNSVMIHDPKTVMVAAAFLGSKVEDATSDVRYLEEGTSVMNAPVPMSDIISAELDLLQGTHFDLLCFHPYKAVLALTEDLRTYLKSDKGAALVEGRRPLSGQDLKPMYDTARNLLDDVVVSDLPLLHNPGQVGLAALMVAQERVQQEQQEKEQKQKEKQQQQQQQLDAPADETAAAAAAATATATATATTSYRIPRIDLHGYVKQRFVEGEDVDRSVDCDKLLETVQRICAMVEGLKDGKYGCGNHFGTDMSSLKAVHKKLKKVRLWGQKDKDKGDSKKKKKKSKEKRAAADDQAGEAVEPEPKRQKTQS